jgi:hypothetical protein
VTFEPKKEELAGEWTSLHNEELNDLYSTSKSLWVIKSKIMRWEGYVAQIGQRRGA